MRTVQAGHAGKVAWWARLARPFHSHCWVCTFYRGVAVGGALGCAAGLALAVAYAVLRA